MRWEVFWKWMHSFKAIWFSRDCFLENVRCLCTSKYNPIHFLYEATFTPNPGNYLFFLLSWWVWLGTNKNRIEISSRFYRVRNIPIQLWRSATRCGILGWWHHPDIFRMIFCWYPLCVFQCPQIHCHCSSSGHILANYLVHLCILTNYRKQKYHEKLM